jgi:hypothetical protein
LDSLFFAVSALLIASGLVKNVVETITPHDERVHVGNIPL